MAFGIFIHSPDSIYDDIPSEQYQFPKRYLKNAKACINDWIIYLEPRRVKNSRGYFAIAQIKEIVPDPRHTDKYLAIIKSGTYLDFGNPVPFNDNGFVIEQGILNEKGNVSGRKQGSIRPLSALDFTAIITNGLGKEEEVLPRIGATPSSVGFEEQQEAFLHPSVRPRIEQLTSRPVRDRNFRKTVLRAYEERCAISGLRLINGGGRAEVEAAHIRPVEKDGPDLVSNGLALSGTAHWMFDRGLVGLSDDLEILVSRQANDPDAVRSMINTTGKLITPKKPADRPRREFVTWHRENCFKI